MPSLGGFLVVPAATPSGERHVIQLVCTLCPSGDAVVAEMTAGWGGSYEGPSVSDLMAAANRHTWKVHRHPSL
jgi:hypothetical protein